VFDLRHEFEQAPVHRFNDVAGLSPAAHVGLVRDNDESVARVLQCATAVGYTGQKPKFTEFVGGIRFSVSNDLRVERAITIEENGGAVFLGFRKGCGDVGIHAVVERCNRMNKQELTADEHGWALIPSCCAASAPRPMM
jgi:hypothetical protein